MIARTVAPEFLLHSRHARLDLKEKTPRSTQSQPGAGQKQGPGTGARPDVERAMLLRDVMDHAVKTEKETARRTTRKPSHARVVALGIVGALVLALSAYSWIARPEFIWGPRPTPLPAAQREAGLRFAMFLLSQRIKAYRDAGGGYPPSLSAIGDSLAGVTYSVSGNVFELRATENGKPIVLRSDQSADAFLGNSTNIIQGLAPK
jgi:hypothetical protein